MKVSAIMPTRGRQRLSALAVISFLSQTYDNKELLILDDAEDPAFEAFQLGRSPSQKIEYVLYEGEQRQTIAAKRNWLCGRATGDIIMHFDSDDWSSPDRMADQVARLQESGKALTGYHSMLFLNAYDDTAWKYHGHSHLYAVGTSLAYRRDWWAGHPFPVTRKENGGDVPLIIGEDNEMVNAAKQAGQIVTVDADKRMVARIHDGNTCKKDCNVDLNGYSFKPVDMSELPKDFWK